MQGKAAELSSEAADPVNCRMDEQPPKAVSIVEICISRFRASHSHNTA